MNFQIQFLPFTWQTINERQAVSLAGMTNHSFTRLCNEGHVFVLESFDSIKITITIVD